MDGSTGRQLPEYIEPSTPAQLQLQHESREGWHPRGGPIEAGWMSLCQNSIVPRLVRALLALGGRPPDLLRGQDCEYVGWQRTPGLDRPFSRVIVAFVMDVWPLAYHRSARPLKGAWFTWYRTGDYTVDQSLEEQQLGPSSGVAVDDNRFSDEEGLPPLWVVSPIGGMSEELKERCLQEGDLALTTFDSIVGGAVRYDTRYRAHLWIDFLKFRLEAVLPGKGTNTALRLTLSDQLEVLIPVIRLPPADGLSVFPLSSMDPKAHGGVEGCVTEFMREFAPQQREQVPVGRAWSMTSPEQGTIAIVWHGPCLVAFDTSPLPLNSTILFTKQTRHQGHRFFGAALYKSQIFHRLGSRTIYKVDQSGVRNLKSKIRSGRRELIERNGDTGTRLSATGFAEAHLIHGDSDVPVWQRCGPADMYPLDGMQLLVFRVDRDVPTRGRPLKGPASFILTIPVLANYQPIAGLPKGPESATTSSTAQSGRVVAYERRPGGAL